MIQVEGLRKHYGGLCAVDGVSFSVQRGEVVGVLGPNGAGKSTTMRMLCGVLAPDAGRVTIDGRVDPARDPKARAQVGYLAEHTPLYRSMLVARFLDYAARSLGLGRRDARRAALKAAAATGLEQHLGRRIDELSKGYRQRVGLAAALIGDPKVLILDEPTSGLDPVEIQRIRALVRELGSDRTVLLSTHVLSEVEELCARVLLFARGQLLADGHPRALAEAEEGRLQLLARGAAERVPALLGRLGQLSKVLRLVPWPSPPTGYVGVELTLAQGSVEERRAAAEAVASEVFAAGFGLVELTHQRASLEAVFLRYTDPTRTQQVAP